MARKQLSISEEVHADLNTMAKRYNTDMVCIVNYLLAKAKRGEIAIDPTELEEEFSTKRLTPAQVKEIAKPYVGKGFTAEEIAESSGLSVMQVRTFVTYDTFKDIVQEFLKDPEYYLAAKAGVKRTKAVKTLMNAGYSKGMSSRLLGIVQGYSKPHPRERAILRENGVSL